MAEHVKPTTTVDPDGRSIVHFQSLAFSFPQEVPDYVQPFLTWFEKVNNDTITLTDAARSFELEILLYQFETAIATILGTEIPKPMEFLDYEQPTKLAYDTRRKKLISEGKFTPPENEDPENPAPLPIEIYVDPMPNLDGLDDEKKENVKKFVTEFYNGFNSSDLLKLTHKNLEMCRALLHQLASNDTWELVRESDGLKTYYRAEKEIATHSFKVTGTVKAEAIDVFTLLYDVTQFHRWFPLMRGCTQIHEITRYAKVCQAIVAAVWPWSDRECLLDCGGVDDSSRGRVLINMRDVEKEHPDYFPPHKDHVRCAMSHGGFMLKPKSLGETEVSFYTNVDPQLALPTSLLNMITGKMIHTLLPTMQQWAPKTQGADSPWQADRANRTLVFTDVQNALEMFFEEEIKERKEKAEREAEEKAEKDAEAAAKAKK